jgi:hypothetical protein
MNRMDGNPYESPEARTERAGKPKRYPPARGAVLGALGGLASIDIAIRMSPGASWPPPRAFLDPELLFVIFGLASAGAAIGGLACIAANWVRR